MPCCCEQAARRRSRVVNTVGERQLEGELAPAAFVVFRCGAIGVTAEVGAHLGQKIPSRRVTPREVCVEGRVAGREGGQLLARVNRIS